KRSRARIRLHLARCLGMRRKKRKRKVVHRPAVVPLPFHVLREPSLRKSEGRLSPSVEMRSKPSQKVDNGENVPATHMVASRAASARASQARGKSPRLGATHVLNCRGLTASIGNRANERITKHTATSPHMKFRTCFHDHRFVER